MKPKVGPSSSEMLRPEHPFGKELHRTMNDPECGVICSAPLVGILSGEHAGVDGAPMVVFRPDLRVWVCLIGRNPSSHGVRPSFSAVIYYDPVRGELADIAQSPLAYGTPNECPDPGPLLDAALERLEGVAPVPQEPRWFTPTEVVVLAQAPPGRGLNWSGAFAAAYAAALYALQGWTCPARWKVEPTDPWRGNGPAECVWRLAMDIEARSHGLPSGYGVACSMEPEANGLLVYKGFLDPTGQHARRVRGFHLKAVCDEPSRLRAGDELDIAAIDSGIPKQTSQTIRIVRDRGERALARPFLAAYAQRLSPLLVDQVLALKQAGYAALASLSICMAWEARNASRQRSGAVQRIADLVRAIDVVLSNRLMLGFSQLDDIRSSVAGSDLAGHLGVKFSGGGRGGTVLVAGRSAAVSAWLGSTETVRPSEREPALVWRLRRDGVADRGLSCEKVQQMRPRPSRPYEAYVLDAAGNLSDEGPSTMYRIRAALRPLAERGPCLWYFDRDPTDHGAPQYDLEPVYMTWRDGATRQLHEARLTCRDGLSGLKTWLRIAAKGGVLRFHREYPHRGDLDALIHAEHAARRALHERCALGIPTAARIGFDVVAHESDGATRALELRLPADGRIVVVTPENRADR